MASTASGPSGGFVDVAPRLEHGHGNAQVGRASRAAHGADFAALTAELDAIFRRRGARAQAAPVDVRLWHGSLRAIASFVLEGDAFARAVVTHVRVWPLFEGVAMVVHPRPEVDAPLLVADLMVPPTGRPRAFVDVCGPAIAEPAFAARFREPLAAILDGADVPRRAPVPAWIAALSGGAGGRLSARRGGGDVLAATLARYVARYLDALDDEIGRAHV